MYMYIYIYIFAAGSVHRLGSTLGYHWKTIVLYECDSYEVHVGLWAGFGSN